VPVGSVRQKGDDRWSAFADDDPRTDAGRGVEGRALEDGDVFALDDFQLPVVDEQPAKRSEEKSSMPWVTLLGTQQRFLAWFL